MTLPLPWTVVDGQTGEIADTQTNYRLVMPAAAQAKAGRIAMDTFTRLDSATLDNAETGQVWELLAGAFAVSSLKAVSSTSSQAVLDVGKVNVVVTATIIPTSGAPGIVVRGGTAATGTTGNDRLAVQLDMGAGAGLVLNMTDSGTGPTAKQTYTRTFTAGTAYELRVLASGNRIVAWLDGGDPLIDYTLAVGAEQTKFGPAGGLTRVGFRNTGAASFDDLIVAVGYSLPTATGAITLADLPAGVMIAADESSSTYIRTSSRTDLTYMFKGPDSPVGIALAGDMWKDEA